MPNEYSVQFHDFITAKLADARQRLSEAEQAGDEQTQAYWNGQLEELVWLRAHLKKHVDLKEFIYYQPGT